MVKAAPALRGLAEIAGASHVRDAVEADAVQGVQPSCVVAPGSEAEVSEVLLLCAREGLAVVVRGGGTAMDRGAPPRACDVVLSTLRLDALVEHEPGDMVCVVQAGMRVEALASSVAAHRQRLTVSGAIDGATIGGVVAADEWGPGRTRFGTARDVVIGARFVLSDGTVGHSGGKVVKNVAGYDVAKLLVGSLGTLAVITELSLRLQPQPLAQREVRFTGLDATRTVEVCEALRSMPLVLARGDLSWPDGTLLVVVEGTEEGVERQADMVAALGGEPCPVTTPDAFDSRCTASLSVPRTQLLALLDIISHHAARILPSLGVAHVALDAATPHDVASLRAAVESLGGHLVLTRAPASLASAVWPAREGVDVDLMRSLKQSLDPAGILAPGRFLGGI